MRHRKQAILKRMQEDEYKVKKKITQQKHE